MPTISQKWWELTTQDAGGTQDQGRHFGSMATVQPG